MITLQPVKKETIEKDVKRKRWILSIGTNYHLHLTRKEVLQLQKDIAKGMLQQEKR